LKTVRFRLLVLIIAAAILALAAAPAPYKERWVPKYFYDEDESSLQITDLKFPSAQRGIASGVVTNQKQKEKPVVVITSDGGERWEVVPVKEPPISLFMLEDGTGWMVTEKAIWKTEEAGRSWRRLNNSPKGMLRVWFNGREHGWAIGERKQVFETGDGGATWLPLAAAAEPNTNPEHTVYGTISFGDPRDGLIAGWSEHPGEELNAPGWVDPEKARKRRQTPTTLSLLQTRNGGKTWMTSITSIFGRVTRVSLAGNGSSLGLIQFTDNFAWPSEVFLMDAYDSGKSKRVFREANRSITDVLLTDSGTAYLAGSETTSVIHSSPIPGKLKILTSRNYKTWDEMPVDYRAEAHRAIIASPNEQNIWVATDMGMILKLVRQQ